MYDFRDEAVCALKPQAGVLETEAIKLESCDFKMLAASKSADVTHVAFKQSQPDRDGAVSDLRKDLAQLTDKLAIGSKVLLDFSGLNLLPIGSIDTLVTFNSNLRHKGSRMVLCCLDPAVRASFFPPAV